MGLAFAGSVHPGRPVVRVQAQEEGTGVSQEHPFPEEADFDMLSNRIAGDANVCMHA